MLHRRSSLLGLYLSSSWSSYPWNDIRLNIITFINLSLYIWEILYMIINLTWKLIITAPIIWEHSKTESRELPVNNLRQWSIVRKGCCFAQTVPIAGINAIQETIAGFDRARHPPPPLFNFNLARCIEWKRQFPYSHIRRCIAVVAGRAFTFTISTFVIA